MTFEERKLKEFDKNFVGITEGTKRVWWVDDPDRVLDFLSTTLSEYKEELLENMPKEVECEEANETIPEQPELAADQARNCTIRQIIQIIKES